MKTLSTQCILTMLNPDQQKELFHALEMIIPKEDLEAKLDKIKDKYYDLVWFARKDDEDLQIPIVKEIYDGVCAKYPDEVRDLRNQHIGNWTHGFNSGMLACARLLSAYCLPHNHPYDYEVPKNSSSEEAISARDQEIEMAEDDFPRLDT